ncbi:sgkB Sphingosine kinase B [Candida maltosa Xu316]|uniref:Putative sphingosine kinase-like protein n=1 Tax=Candida maltosa (strain Xu316) TaxID=1245528 RepID=M3JZ28_CANMX|nr:putative sphingosine kinase-like protein [Candida maltosa Xu316]
MSTTKVLYKPKNLEIEFGEKDGGYFLRTNESPTSSETTTTTISSLPSYLTRGKIIVIDSVNSGIGRSDEKNIYSKIINPLFDHLSIPHEYFPTTSPSSISDLALSFKDPEITVIFISGDTSINEFVNGLNDTTTGKISIFPIPGGTGNSLALSLNLTDPLSSISTLLTGKPDPLNLYQVEFPKNTKFLVQNEVTDEVPANFKFLVVLSWAFHASLVADSDTPELRKHGLQRFQIAAYQNLEREQKYEGQVIINNDEVINGPFAYWLLTSAQKFEPTFEISPQGDILKDELYLVAFETKTDKDYIMDIMKQVYDKGSHVSNPDVVYKKLVKGDSIVLKTKNSNSVNDKRFCVDGSIVVLPDTTDNEIRIQVTNNKQYSWELYIIH